MSCSLIQPSGSVSWYIQARASLRPCFSSSTPTISRHLAWYSFSQDTWGRTDFQASLKVMVKRLPKMHPYFTTIKRYVQKPNLWVTCSRVFISKSTFLSSTMLLIQGHDLTYYISTLFPYSVSTTDTLSTWTDPRTKCMLSKRV